MKGRLLLAGAIVLAAVQPAQAQGGPTNPGCTGLTGDACQQAADMFQLLAPQLGLALTGGNPLPGSGGTLGGFPHIALSVRGVAFQGDLPEVDSPAWPGPVIGGAQSNSLPSKKQLIGLPNVDAAIGVFKGIPLGVTNVGGVDILVNATYLPTIDGSGVSIEPETNLKIGYGARVGLLQESILVPGVSVTWVKRDLPTTTVTADAGSTTFTISDMAVKTTAIRGIVSKSFLVFGLAAGVGQDKYDQAATVSASGVPSAVPVSQDLTRTNVFGNVSLNLPLLKIVGEVGQVSGGKALTHNSFDGEYDAAKSRTYFSAGLRLQF